MGDQVVDTPSIAHGVVYVSSGDGNLYAIHALTGSVAWTAPSAPSASPTIANGIVYTGGADGLVKAFDAKTGDLLWSFDPGGGLLGKVAVADGRVYFGNDTDVFAMQLPAGS